ncbi:MAG TPA: DUF2062 domain-containing protein [Steroidobacteraceae bacterium]|nr:DUF2062 domain-containing protein [Steroidobacteraceae bacterium]
MMQWLRRRVFAPLLALLTHGVSPRRLAICVAIGVVVGNIPILGVSTVMCALIALTCRLNLPAMQLVQALMAPTQLLLIIPFVRLGEWLFAAPRQPLSVEASLAVFRNGLGPAVILLWDSIIHASVAWALVSPLAVFAIYALLVPVFQHAAERIGRGASPPA